MHNVRTLTRRTDPDRVAAAASAAFALGDTDLADLLRAIADAMRTVDRPALTDVEMWRWSAVVAHARRISRELIG